MPLGRFDQSFGVEDRLRNDAAADVHDRDQALDVSEHVIHRQRVRDAPAVLECPRIDRCVSRTQDHVVRQQHTLGAAGRARRIKDVTDIAGADLQGARCQLLVRRRRRTRLEFVQRPHARPQIAGRGEAEGMAQRRKLGRVADLPSRREGVEVGEVVVPAVAVHRDQHGGLRLEEHVRQLIASQVKIDRDRHGAGAQDGELGRDELGIVPHDQGDMVSRLHAACHQARGKSAGPGVHLGIAEASRFRDDQRRIRVSARGLCEARRDRMRLPTRITPVQFGAPGGGASRSRLCSYRHRLLSCFRYSRWTATPPAPAAALRLAASCRRSACSLARATRRTGIRCRHGPGGWRKT